MKRWYVCLMVGILISLIGLTGCGKKDASRSDEDRAETVTDDSGESAGEETGIDSEESTVPLIFNKITIEGNDFEPAFFTFMDLYDLGFHFDWEGQHYSIYEGKMRIAITESDHVTGTEITAENFPELDCYISGGADSYHSFEYRLVNDSYPGMTYKNPDVDDATLFFNMSNPEYYFYEPIIAMIQNWQSNEELDYKNCQVTSLIWGINDSEVTQEQMDRLLEVYPEISLEGITLGSSEEEVRKVFGDFIEQEGESGNVKQIYCRNDVQRLEFYLFNGQVSRIKYSWHLNYFFEG